MAKSIVVILPHDLGATEARRRIAEGLGPLQQSFAGKLTSDVRWSGNHADIDVGALGQKVTAQLEIEEKQVRVEVQLPWLLAALANKITPYLQKSGSDMLRIPPPTK
jgi:Putative polyhydroxyalkanoic acid system protein (PHA_gran_rgn)